MMHAVLHRSSTDLSAALPPCRSAPRHPLHRRGFNLIEVLFASSAISALALVAMTVIAMLMTAEQHAAEGVWIDHTVANLADDLRADAHRATDLEATPDADNQLTQITFRSADAPRIVWQCTPDGVTRQQLQEDTVLSTETYRLALGHSTFMLPGDDGLLTWTHTRDVPNVGGLAESESTDATPTRTYHIVAAVGLNTPPPTEDTP